MIPMVIVGGWLGSGKTTYINQMLRDTNGERLAVIVNDVGELNIDVELIATHAGSTIELTNGCVCCTIGGSLGLTLKDLVDSDNPPDRIVVEASGIADPAAVSKYGDKRVLAIEAIVVLVDVQTIAERLSDPYGGGLYRAQVEAADAVIPTKLDLGDVGAWQAMLADADSGPVAEFRVETATWRPDGPVGLDAVRDWLVEAKLWRAKGFVRASDGNRWLIQAVGGTVELSEVEAEGPEGIVVIGYDLRDALASVPAPV